RCRYIRAITSISRSPPTTATFVGEFTGHYSGGRNMTVGRIDKVSYRTRPIFESLYLGMPWTEIDYLMGPATCVPLYQQL
ncbi:UbiD family decarboxylase, partial [Escherichia coli]|nr:UbiD family decarboxylase [Escherichia coli]